MATNFLLELTEHGIQDEQSDLRAHVSPVTRGIYVFRTKVACELALSGRYPKRSAWQPGIANPTAEGVLVPTADIPGLEVVRFEQVRWWEFFGATQYELDTSAKGRYASNVVTMTLDAGVFPLPAKAEEQRRRDVQIAGIDLIVWAGWRIQVKCDWLAGSWRDDHGRLVGTGNVYLQLAERNPLKLF